MRWHPAFDARGVGALSAAWGSSANDVFVVGGTPAQGEVYHFDGTVWRAMAVPVVPLLVWVHGFGPGDVMAVGLGGGVLQFDGRRWTRVDSGTTENLWGIWGPTPDDRWIVGGAVGSGAATILHFDGTAFEPAAVPPNDRNATALFKVWGVGQSVFAVGEQGVILQYAGGSWFQVDGGPDADDDLVALWGTREDHIVAVGGRSTARIAVYDGAQWTTQRLPAVPGLNAVYMVADGQALIGGNDGTVGVFDVGTAVVMLESADTTLAVHALWSAGGDTFLGVGGQFRSPYSGLALTRTRADAPPTTAGPPLPALPEQCAENETLQDGVCVALPSCPGSDDDADGLPSDCDNCPDVANPNQEDADGDAVGDACDVCPGHDDRTDDDGDGVPNGCDVCAAGDDRLNADGDTAPDACDVCPEGSDKYDSDGDGVPDACDICATSDDAIDSDEDGTPDGCDLCAGSDDTLDADADGVPDGCDTCAGGDDTQDADTDQVPDACDACPGFDDALDSDADGVPNGCDVCDGADEQDADADSVPDACDTCPNFDDTADEDVDGVPDGCDVCAGFDDALDADADGVPDGCDACPDADDQLDEDADGTPDACDACPGSNDAADRDADTVPDGCDTCPGSDDALDADADGVPDGCDICPGFDDTVDSDGDGIPDGCCAHETGCPLGSICVEGLCQVTTEPDLEVGFGGAELGCFAGEYTQLQDGAQLPVCEGFQGFTDVFLTLRSTGFAPNAAVFVTRLMIATEFACTLQEDCPLGWVCLGDFCSPSSQFTAPRDLTDIGGGVNELTNFHFILFDNVNNVDGVLVTLIMTITDQADMAVTATAEMDVRLFGSRMCFDGACPDDQPCVEDFCQMD